MGFSLLGRMEAWSSRFRVFRERFFKDDEDDDMEMAVDQFQNFIDFEPRHGELRVVHAKAGQLTLSETE